jgi:tetratricopeptide (TPR) repeat protein
MSRQSLIGAVLLLGLLSGCAGTTASSPDQEATVSKALPDFDSWWDYGDPAATQARFETLRAGLEAATDADYRLQLLTQIARTLGLQGRFDEAHLLLDEVESSLDAPPSVARVRYLLERGRALRSSGKSAQATPLFEEAFAVGRRIGADYHAVDAAHMVALAVDSTEARRHWSLLGIEIAATSAQPRARHWLGSIQNNLGWDYHESGDYELALKMFQQALAARVEEEDEEAIGIARWCVARWCVARCYRSLDRIDEALTIQLGLSAQYDEAGKEDGYVHEELGELFLLQGDESRATTHFASAWKLLSADDWLQANEGERLARLRQLGAVE